MSTTALDLRAFIRDIPDFPKAGIIFKDITPLLLHPDAFDETIRLLSDHFLPQDITKVVAIESRGFIFGGCVARALHCGLIPIRKPGKLPWQTARFEYALEYGTDVLEMHNDAIEAGDRVLIVDDVLATGGTAAAAAALVGQFGADLAGFGMVIELAFLNGRQKLGNIPVHSLIQYD
jgi:adenine phosphoribosyltransferase